MGRKNYPAEYKRRMVDQVKAGRRVAELAREFQVSETAIRRWVEQASVDAGAQPGTTTSEREELIRLRRQVAQLEEEREILKKFAAWSAQESNWAPRRRGGS